MRPKSKAKQVAEQALLQVTLLLKHRLRFKRKAEVKEFLKLLDRAYAQAHFDSFVDLPNNLIVTLDDADVFLAIRNHVNRNSEIFDLDQNHNMIEQDWKDGKLKWE